MLLCDFVCLAETWLQHDEEISENLLVKSFSKPFLANRKFDAECTQYRQGGIAIFKKRRPGLKSTQIKKFASPLDNSILFYNNVVIICIYKHPRFNIELFRKEINTILQCVTNECTHVILFGDFNENLMDKSNKKPIYDFLTSLDYIDLINVNPTNIPTTEGGTCIDHIYISKNMKDIEVCIMPIYYSYHEMLKIVVRNWKQ